MSTLSALVRMRVLAPTYTCKCSVVFQNVNSELQGYGATAAQAGKEEEHLMSDVEYYLVPTTY